MDKKYCIMGVAAVVLFLSVLPAAASESSMAALEENVDRIIAILKTAGYQEKKGETKEEAVYEITRSAFDFRTLSMLALGRNWRRFSNDEKAAFTKYFSRLVTQVYLSKIEGEALDSITIDYLKTEETTPAGKLKRSDVYTSIRHDGVKTPVVYRMLKASDGWKIYDVKIEGVSMAGNYREQYRKRVMDSPEKIIEELKHKVEE